EIGRLPFRIEMASAHRLHGDLRVLERARLLSLLELRSSDGELTPGEEKAPGTFGLFLEARAEAKASLEARLQELDGRLLRLRFQRERLHVALLQANVGLDVRQPVQAGKLRRSDGIRFQEQAADGFQLEGIETERGAGRDRAPRRLRFGILELEGAQPSDENEVDVLRELPAGARKHRFVRLEVAQLDLQILLRPE